MAELSPLTPIRIEIVSDIVCPWCYIGKHRLDAAIASYASLDADLHWRPFQLDRNIPADGIDLHAYAAKLQNEHEAAANQALASEAGKEFGLVFAWDKITRMPNTRDAHRLIRHAALYGVQMKIVERLFKAYFCDGIDIGSQQRLIALAEECGIDGYAAGHLFAADDDLLALEEELAKTRHLNLPSVPFFVFADEVILPADATSELFAAALFRAQELQIGPGASPS